MDLELVSNEFFVNVEETYFAETSHIVFKGCKGGPFKHTKPFFSLNV